MKQSPIKEHSSPLVVPVTLDDPLIGRWKVSESESRSCGRTIMRRSSKYQDVMRSMTNAAPLPD